MGIPTQLPGVHYGPGPRGVGPALRVPPRWIIVHDTGNTASASDEAHFAASRTDDRSRWTSAHFYVDTTGVIGSVPLTEQAWAAFGNANTHGWQLEMSGHDTGTAGAVPVPTLANAAQLVAQLARLGGIPARFVDAAGIAAGQSGITGHLEFTQEEHRAGGHTDPGYSFDWAHFIALVDTALGQLPAPAGDNWTELIVDNLPTLAQGASGPAVKRLQALMVAAGGNVGASGIDGQFGPDTAHALAQLQARYHVTGSTRADGTGDGIAGPGSWTWLLTWA